MKDRKQTTITLIILATILIAGVLLILYLKSNDADTAYEETAAYQALTTPEGVPSYTDAEGNEVELVDDVPKTVVVYSWASWCPACKQELNELDSFAGALDIEEVEVLAINRKEDVRTAKRFLNTLPDLENIEIVLDPADYLFESIDGYAVPEILVYDETGALVLHERTTFHAANVVAAIEAE